MKLTQLEHRFQEVNNKDYVLQEPLQLNQEVILMDEPTSALDLIVTEKLKL